MKKYNVDKVLVSLIDNLETQQKLNKKNYSSIYQVDGTIIGNGSQDFTKTYVEYNFKINDEDCQLIDVPGIEGKEAKYINIIKKAIKKAHLVCYVAREDKGIEETTLDKIKSYLGNTVEVMGIHNINVNPQKEYDGDDYLGDLKSGIEKSAKASKNIAEALQRVVPEDLYVTTVSTAVLPALCSLAVIDGNRTSFAEPKEFEEKLPEVQGALKTLRRQQENFFLHCYRKDLLDASRITDLRNAIIKSCGNTPDRIKKSAYVRLDAQANEFYDLVNDARIGIKNFYESIKRRTEKFKNDMDSIISQMKRNNVNSIRNTIFDFYRTELLEKIIEPHIENNGKVKKEELEYKLNTVKDKLAETYGIYIRESVENSISDFSEKIKKLVKEYQHDIQKDFEIFELKLPTIDIKEDFSDIGKIAIDVVIDIGGWALSGSSIGGIIGGAIGGAISAAGGGITADEGAKIGAAIGAAIGSAIGAVIFYLKTFAFTKVGRIAKWKNQMREKIDDIANDAWKELSDECDRISNELASKAKSLPNKYDGKHVYSAEATLKFVNDFLEKQDALRKEIKQKINSLEVSYAN